jgi:type I restriction enzyme M protein
MSIPLTPEDHTCLEDGRWSSFTYDDLMARDKLNLDIFWLRDESLEDTANLPHPDVLAAEIVHDLRAALEQFSQLAAAFESNQQSCGPNSSPQSLLHP